MIVGMPRTRTRRTQAQRTAETTTALLDATLDLLAASGYKATTTTAVAQRAGVSLGALLHHFPTKTDLLTGAIEHAFDRRMQEYRQLMAEADPTADTLDSSLDLLWSMCEGPTFTVFVELWVAARTEPELIGPLVAVDREFLATAQQMYTDYFLGPGANEEVARVGLQMVFSLLSGLAFSNMIPGYDPFDSAPVIATFKGMVRISLAALKSQPPQQT